MQSYLYQFNYPPAHKELWKLETKYLFNERLMAKELITDKDIPIDCSVFIKAKIKIVAFHQDIEKALEILKDKNVECESFKVIYLKNENTHVEYNKTLEVCNLVSKCIKGRIMMKEPDTMIAVTRINNQWYIGYYQHGVPNWKNFANKPYTFSNALDLRLARTVINIACKNNPNITVVDPCCGMGTVVLEGLALGMNIRGYDISREISYKGRLNVEYFGFEPTLIKKSAIADIKEYYDVAIIDIPYNLYAPITYEEQCDILVQARRICKRFILISYDDMSKELVDAGFEIIDYCGVKKTEFTSFERKLYVCQ